MHFYLKHCLISINFKLQNHESRERERRERDESKAFDVSSKNKYELMLINQFHHKLRFKIYYKVILGLMVFAECLCGKIITKGKFLD